MCPGGGITFGHDVGVTFKEERRARAGLTEPRDDVRSAGSHGLNLDVEAFLGQPPFDVLGDRGFGGVGIAKTDDARDADQIARERDQLGGIDVSEGLGITRGGTKG